MAIAERVKVCIQAFKQLTETIPDKKVSGLNDLFSAQLGDQYGQFRVWAGNTGAHQIGRSSLDYRLRDATQLQGRVLEILKDLEEYLVDASSIVCGDKIPWEISSSLDSSSDEDEIRFDREDRNKETQSDGETGMNSTELGQVLTNVTEDISCLLRLSVAMRNRGPHNRFKASVSFDNSYSKWFYQRDIDHVRSKFPTAEDFLAVRLGKVNSERRQFFKYRKERHDKRKEALEKNFRETTTVASSLPSHLKDAAIVASGLKVPNFEEDRASDSGLSQTSYAASDVDPYRLRVPSLPENAEYDIPFECPYCQSMVSESNRKTWKRHVFADLRPYVCVVKDCPTPTSSFGRRRQWSEHQTKYHWKEWTCAFGCSEKFSSGEAFRTHIAQLHPKSIDEYQLNLFVDACGYPLGSNIQAHCPLCSKEFQSRKAFDRHVGQHLEDLALFTLPNILEEREEGESAGNNNKELELGASTDEEDELDDNAFMETPVHIDLSFKSKKFEQPGVDPNTMAAVLPEREREREHQRERERKREARQLAFLRECERERKRDIERERERKFELELEKREREIELQRIQKREYEREFQKRELEQQRELERQYKKVLERKREREIEREIAQRELERKREIEREIEHEVEREIERELQRERDLEAQREHERELEREREIREREREIEARERERELERIRARDRERRHRRELANYEETDEDYEFI